MYFRVEHRLGVAAPAADIWAVLADLEAWPQWAAMYPRVAGVLRIGQRLTVVERLDGQPERPLQPTIVDWVPNTQILWRSTASGGLLKRTRYFEIEALSDTGCAVSNGEYVDGFLARWVPRERRRAMRAGFEAFGEALKARVMDSR